MDGIYVKFIGQLFPAQSHDPGGHLIRITLLDEIKITKTVKTIQVRVNGGFTLTHFMGVYDDSAFRVLPENCIQVEYRYATRVDHIRQHIPGFYGWKLG